MKKNSKKYNNSEKKHRSEKYVFFTTKILTVLLSLNFIILLLFFISFNDFFLQKNLNYTSESFEQTKYNKNFNKQILEYIKNYNNVSIDDYSLLKQMTYNEKKHIEDVKLFYNKFKRILVKNVTVLFFILSLILLYYKDFRRENLFLIREYFIKTQIVFTIILTIIFLFVLFLLYFKIFSFNTIFGFMHKPFFEGNYAFPYNSILKSVYTNSFFERIIIEEYFILLFFSSILFCYLKCISRISSSSKT